MFHEAVGKILARRTRGTMVWEVLVTGDGRLIKRYLLGHGSRRPRKPWRREHKALTRLSGLGFPESYGYTERQQPAGREIVFVRQHVPGTPLCRHADLLQSDLPHLARMFAVIHRHGVITDDASIGNYVRRPDGSLVFVDFGRAIVLRRRTLRFYYRVGHELAKLLRETLAMDEARFAVFLSEYRSQTRYPVVGCFLVNAGMALPRWTRTVRNVRFRLLRRKQSAS